MTGSEDLTRIRPRPNPPPPGAGKSPVPGDLGEFRVSTPMLEIDPVAHGIVVGNRFAYANPAFEALTGYRRDALSALSPSDLLSSPPSSPLPQVSGYEAGHPLGIPLEARLTTRDGALKWVVATTVPLNHVQREAALLTLVDLTGHRERVETLSRSERKYKTVFELAPDMIFVHDTSGIMIDLNPGAARRLGYAREEIVDRKGLLDVWSRRDTERFECIREETLRDGEWLGEIESCTSSGQTWFCESHARVAELGGETIIIVMSRDVTERKRMEAQIQAALAEKEMLLREVHHRVKNNLQIICSLLTLQLRDGAGERARELIRESRSRILSMAMIHEKLYLSEGVHQVRFRDYVTDLVHEILGSFGSAAHSISVRLEIDDVAFRMKTAIPCGLILIELVSNAVKHAFPNGRRGEITVALHADGAHGRRLSVRDNGIGIPEGLKIAGLKSLGLRLVSDLARHQLQGRMGIARDGGTTVHVTFKTTEAHSGLQGRP